MKNVFYFTAPFFLTAILQIISLAVYVNYINPEQFGIYDDQDGALVLFGTDDRWARSGP